MAYFYVKHEKTHTVKELFAITGTDTQVQKAVQQKRDDYGKGHEVVNVSPGRYKQLKKDTVS